MSTLMRRAHILTLLLLVPVLVQTHPARAQESATITGIVSGAETGEALPGALAAMRAKGSADVFGSDVADEVGQYVIGGLEAGTYLLEIRFVGFEMHRTEITLVDGETQVVNVALMPTLFMLDSLYVESELERTKFLESTTATNVVHAREIEEDVAPSPTDALRRVPGLDLARTGIDRRELVLRGFGKTFTGATYVMTDYRQSAIASLGVNAYNMMPVSSIDLDRIEVLRGPAGAVYGPGVDEGAIHFMSKDPFTYPGTTIALGGGQQSMMHAQVRHAGVVGATFGYKINAQYLNAEEWRLDPSDPHDADLIRRYYSVIPLDTEVSKVIVNGTAAYKLGRNTRLTGIAGFATAKSPFLSDIGPLQSDGFGYRFGQLRLTSGRFFAQAYLNANDAGDSFVYAGPGVAEGLSGEAVVDNSTQLNLQAQYGFDVMRGKEHITFGVDFENTNPSTKGTINGRNEDADQIREYGVYAQSLTDLSENLKLTLASRLDYDNFFEKLQVSPRAAIVYKPIVGHSVRATFNRAFASPGTNSLFLDILARSGDAMLPFEVRARGAGHGFTFEHNAAYQAFAQSDLVATSILPFPETYGQPAPVGLPLDMTYGWIYDGLSQIPLDVLRDMLCDLGYCFQQEQVAYLRNELAPDQTPVTGFSDGSLALLDLTTGGYEMVSDAPDVAPLKQSSTQTLELGYKGVLGRHLLISLDGYYTVKENFVRGLQLETPFVLAPSLREDLVPAIAGGIHVNEELATVLSQLGLTPAEVAQLLVSLSDPSLPSASTPVGIVQPMQNNPGLGQSPELLMTYRNFGRVEFFGLEAAIDLIVDEQTSAHGSLSWVSDDFFDHEELDEENADLYVSLNAPTFKAGAGVSHRFRNGLSLLAGGKYVQGFTVRSGPYNGYVDDYFLLDLGAGFDFGKFAPGLRLDVTVQNVLDHMHREFIGAPKMGRLGLARFTYSLN